MPLARPEAALALGSCVTLLLGPPIVPFYPLLGDPGEGSPTKIDYSEKGTLILTSLRKNLVCVLDFPFGSPVGLQEYL